RSPAPRRQCEGLPFGLALAGWFYSDARLPRRASGPERAKIRLQSVAIYAIWNSSDFKGLRDEGSHVAGSQGDNAASACFKISPLSDPGAGLRIIPVCLVSLLPKRAWERVRFGSGLCSDETSTGRESCQWLSILARKCTTK